MIVAGTDLSKKFMVTTEEMDSASTTKEHMAADYVVVCNGNYAKPFIPKFPNISSFAGDQLHAHSIRKISAVGAQTKGKHVLVVGARASGMDMIIAMARCAEATPEMIYVVDLGIARELVSRMDTKKCKLFSFVNLLDFGEGFELMQGGVKKCLGGRLI